MTDTPDDAPADQAPLGAGRYQFTLRTMLIMMTVFSVLLSGLFACPPWVGALIVGVLVVLVPMALTIGVIYGRGNLHTFCIGALYPAGVTLIFFHRTFYTPFLAGISGRSGSEQAGIFFSIAMAVYSAMVVVFGLLAMGVRRWVETPAALSPLQPHDGDLNELAVAPPEHDGRTDL